MFPYISREEAVEELLSAIINRSKGESMEAEERIAVKQLNGTIKSLKRRLARLEKARNLILGADEPSENGQKQRKHKRAKATPGVLKSHLISLFKNVPSHGMTAKQATMAVIEQTDYKFMNGQNEQNIVRSCIVRMVNHKEMTKTLHDERGMVYYLKTDDEPKTQVTRSSRPEVVSKDRGLSDPEVGKTFDSEKESEEDRIARLKGQHAK
jgi:hypothetical protein